MNALNLQLRKSLSYLLLPVMILFSFSAFANNSYGSTLPRFAHRKTVDCSTQCPALNITENPFKYSGAYYDNESGLYYLHARYYSPKLMRFINRDTYDLSNRYAYCNGEPISQTDPTGHMPRWAKDLLGIIPVAGIVLGVMDHNWVETGVSIGTTVALLATGAAAGLKYFGNAAAEAGANGAAFADSVTEAAANATDSADEILPGDEEVIPIGRAERAARQAAARAERAERAARQAAARAARQAVTAEVSASTETNMARRTEEAITRITARKTIEAAEARAARAAEEETTMAHVRAQMDARAIAKYGERIFNPFGYADACLTVSEDSAAVEPAAAASAGEEEEVMVQEFKGGFRAAARAARRGKLPKATRGYY